MSNLEKKTGKDINATLKFILDMGPLLLFFISYKKSAWLIENVSLFHNIDIKTGSVIPATAVFMASSVIAMAVYWILTRHIPIATLISVLLALIFGGMTLFFADERFIKLKITFVNLIFSAILFVGLLLKKNPLSHLFKDSIKLTTEGWTIFTRRWALFFLAMAIINEIVWRSFSTETWAYLKVFGYLIFTFVFMICQMPLLKKYSKEDH